LYSCKKSDGLECWNEYDDKGCCIHLKWNDGTESWNKYYKTGGNAYCITESNDSGVVWIDKLEYYEDGKTLKKVVKYAYNKH